MVSGRRPAVGRQRLAVGGQQLAVGGQRSAVLGTTAPVIIESRLVLERERGAMPKVSAAHMQSRREQIVRAAIAEFSANGIHSTSMAAIIAASGLSAGAIYTHFSGKDEIIAFASQTAISGVFAGVEHALKDLPPQNEAAIFQLITAGINEAAVSPGFIVQVWA
ncbi:TetR/AcrR family transcriptional regulator, partial [Leucobacter albus]|uniref:TetR/AcrR family transcriptional regulator n=1 Tax=Leucobacter albus TaxID=272210 RepID=UPI0031D924BC